MRLYISSILLNNEMEISYCLYPYKNNLVRRYSSLLAYTLANTNTQQLQDFRP